MGPLQGVRVLDLSRLLPGPFCTRMFADMGADVIKIEEPVKGDYAREFVPRRGDFACWFMEVNRNKRSVALDLKQETDKNVFLEMVRQVDVVVESFRPGVLKKLGIDFATVSQINPKIVYCSISGYGTKGPLVQQADHDIGYQSLAGLVSLSGKRYGRPAIPGVLIADMQASAMAGMSILAALHHAEKTGEGQEISISLFDTCLALVPGVSATYFGNGFVNVRGNNWLSGGNPNYNIYQTEDGRYVSVGCLEEKFWANLCNLLERPDLIPLIQDESEFIYIKHELSAIFAERPLKEWMELAKGSDACLAPVLNYDEALATEQAQADEMVLEIEDAELGNYKTMGFVPKFSKTPCAFYRRAPRLGENTEEVLEEILNK
ncbi:MAG: CoA transferase [Acidaminococcaceae bacterium]|nr:CoA transferase [Acidaminococcaceae bacterium]HBX74907.1 CoA transferase [Acidaminococcaceae bacterium]